MRKRTKKLLILGVWAAAAHASAQVREVRLVGPQRDFGYLVGDVISVDALIDLVPGTKLDASSLPVPGPLNAATELRRIDATMVQTGAMPELRLHAEYQTFLAPDRVTETDLPGYAVRLTQGDRQFTALIPAWPFHVSPLRVAQRSVDDLAALRPDRLIRPLPEAGIRRRLVAALLVAALAGAIFVQGRGWLPGFGRRGPFQTAAHAIGRLRRGGGSAEATYTELHRALDATAGGHVFAGEVGDFIRAHPAFAPARDQLAAFLAVSEARFFGAPGSVPPEFDLLRLAKYLGRLERRR